MLSLPPIVASSMSSLQVPVRVHRRRMSNRSSICCSRIHSYMGCFGSLWTVIFALLLFVLSSFSETGVGVFIGVEAVVLEAAASEADTSTSTEVEVEENSSSSSSINIFLRNNIKSNNNNNDNNSLFQTTTTTTTTSTTNTNKFINDVLKGTQNQQKRNEENRKCTKKASSNKSSSLIRHCPKLDVLTSDILQLCIDLCLNVKPVGRCCGNRLNGQAPQTNSGFLSCANGCEMAYYIGSNSNTNNNSNRNNNNSENNNQHNEGVNKNNQDTDNRFLVRRRDTPTPTTTTTAAATVKEDSATNVLIQTCKKYCDEGNSNSNNDSNTDNDNDTCTYLPPYAKFYGMTIIKKFYTCGSCQEEEDTNTDTESSCSTRNIDRNECYEGCELAATIRASSKSNNNSPLTSTSFELESGEEKKTKLLFYTGVDVGGSVDDIISDSRNDIDTIGSISSSSFCEDDNSDDVVTAIDRYPRFLFAGQSNMVGYSNQARAQQFRELLDAVNNNQNNNNHQHNNPKNQNQKDQSELKQRFEKNRMIQNLISVIEQGQESNVKSATYEAELLYKLATTIDDNNSSTTTTASHLLDKERILKPHPTIVCSLTVPPEVTYSDDNTDGDNFDCERPVTPTACGYENVHYGPELMFAHTFSTLYESPYYNQNYMVQEGDVEEQQSPQLGIVKVGRGGTKIQQWMKNDNNSDNEYTNYWLYLRDAIRAADGTIEAFVWFQGESEELVGPFGGGPSDTLLQREKDIELLYFNRLQTLVSDVRTEIFRAYRKYHNKNTGNKNKNSGTSNSNSNSNNRVLDFQFPDEIPVVIVELGSWAATLSSDFPGPIITAQRRYVESDTNSILVNTGANKDQTKRLSHYYHYDAASMLIIGDRIAQALATLTSALSSSSTQYQFKDNDKDKDNFSRLSNKPASILPLPLPPTKSSFTTITPTISDNERESSTIII